MALPATDDFDDVGPTALETYNANWDVTINAMFAYSNTAVSGTGSDITAARWTGDTFDDDQQSEALIIDVAGGTSSFIGVAVRMSSDGDGYCCDCTTDGEAFISRLDNGSETELDTGTIGGGSIDGDTLRLEAEGTTITAYLNDSEVFSETDATYGSGDAGIKGYNAAASVGADTWEGDDLAASARSITSSISEAADAIAAALDVPAQLSTSISEPGDTVAASLAAQVEASLSVAIDEDGDSTTAATEVLLQVATNISESSDTVAASFGFVASISAAVAEAGDTSAANYAALVQIAASVTESGDATAAVIQAAASISAGITEAADIAKARILPPDYKETFFTVAYAGLDADSPFAGDATYSAIEIGDSCVYEIESTPDAHTMSMTGDGVFSLSPTTLSQDQEVDFYIWDASDETLGTQGTITIEPAVGADITAAVTEGADTAAATLEALIQITASISEPGDSVSATMGHGEAVVIAGITEAADTPAAALDVLDQIIVAVNEQGDGTAATLGVLAQLTTNIDEAGDTVSAAVTADVTRDIAAAITENGDVGVTSVQVLVQTTAAITEINDIVVAAIGFPGAVTEGGGSGGKQPHGSVVLPTRTIELPKDYGYTDEELAAIAIAVIQEFYEC